jgi:RNA polymerase sigma factor (sigma-70 family)
MHTEMPADDFQLLIESVRDGSEDAAWTLIEEYGPYVLRTVRKSLNAGMRSKFDSQDFVQAAWASFFLGKHRSAKLDSPQELIAFLAAIARNKVIDEVRRRTNTLKHDVKRERSFEHMTELHGSMSNSQEPTPSQIAIARERWASMLKDQPERYQQILHLRFVGETNQTIADKLGINEKTVRRVLEKILQDQNVS